MNIKSQYINKIEIYLYNMSVKPRCSDATFAQVARLRGISTKEANLYIDTLDCSLGPDNPRAYITKTDELKRFPGDVKAKQGETGTCPTLLTPIDTDTWKTFAIGQQMSKQSFCRLATVDMPNKKLLVTLGNQLIDTATELYTKIRDMEKQNSSYKTSRSEESVKLKKQIESYKYFLQKIRVLQAERPLSTLGGQVEDSRLLRTSGYYQYIVWAALAAICLSMAGVFHILKKK